MMENPPGILKQEMESELRGNILPFWMNYTPDHQHGGFAGFITHDNKVKKEASKGAVMNARILWTFSAAYNRFRDSSYLEMADRAYQYICQFFTDPRYGGVYWEVDFRGSPLKDRKQIYAIAFVLYGLTEYYRATGNNEAITHAIKLYHRIERYARDRKKNGYEEAFTRKWEPLEDRRLSAKDENENKTMNTHLHILEAYTSLYRVWSNPTLKKSLHHCITLFLEHFIHPENHHLNLFFDDDWNLKSSLVSFGHDIECSWLLTEAADVMGEPLLRQRCKTHSLQLAKASREGLDNDHGLMYEFFPSENRWDTDKHWWPQAEAVVGYFNAFQLSGDRSYLNLSLESWEFIKNYLVDKTYGEWYWSVNKQGVPQTQNEKAGFWKCPYHNGRMCLEIIRRIENGSFPPVTH